jgi:hypothetical protein
VACLLGGCAEESASGAGKSEETASESASGTATATASPTATPAEVAIPGDGTFTVGTDVEPGIYVAEGGEECRWARLGRMDVDYDDVIARGFVMRPVVEIMDDDGGFNTDGCGSWTALDSYAGSLLEEIPGDGIWIVGADLDPGTYVAEGGDWCLWQRISAFRAETDSIIKGGSSRRATIEAGDVAFYTEGCGTWTKSD